MLNLIDKCNTLSTKYRRSVFTLTSDVSKNLSKYGHIICIDPTYPNLTSNWTMIPISVIGHSRELLSGSVIFSSKEVYYWMSSN